MILRSTLALWLAIVANSLSASDNHAFSDSALSLETVYGLAVDQAPSLAIAQYRVQSAEAQKSEAAGAILPQITLFGEWSENSLSYDSPVSTLYGEQDYPGERMVFRCARRHLTCLVSGRFSAERHYLLAQRAISLKLKLSF